MMHSRPRALGRFSSRLRNREEFWDRECGKSRHQGLLRFQNGGSGIRTKYSKNRGVFCHVTRWNGVFTDSFQRLFLAVWNSYSNETKTLSCFKRQNTPGFFKDFNSLARGSQWGCSKHGTRLIFWMFHATRLTPLRPSTNNTVIWTKIIHDTRLIFFPFSRHTVIFLDVSRHTLNPIETLLLRGQLRGFLARHYESGEGPGMSLVSKHLHYYFITRAKTSVVVVDLETEYRGPSR